MMIKLEREGLFDDMDEDEALRNYISPANAFGKALSEYNSDNSMYIPGSPATPTSVLPEAWTAREKQSYSPSLLLPFRLQAVAKLNPIDVKRLSFHMFPHALEDSKLSIQSNERESKERPEMEARQHQSEVKAADADDVFFLDNIVEVKEKCENKVDNRKIAGTDSIRTIKDNGGNWAEISSSQQLQEMDVLVPPLSLPKLRLNVSEQVAPLLSSQPLSLPNNLIPQTSVPPTRSIELAVPPPNLLSHSAPPLTPVAVETPPPPPPVAPGNSAAFPLPSTPPRQPMALRTSASPPSPPPPMGVSKRQVPPPPPMALGPSAPTPPIGLSKGRMPPPPPPPGRAGAINLRPRKATTKLKRSPHMGYLYQLLKKKIEGSNLDGRSSLWKGKIGAASGGKQGMADALAEMIKRSAYFQKIEEDVKNYAGAIKEVKIAINSFQTSDMAELLKFHKYVESQLEKLTDETQVLSRFEEFPSKTLEALRMAAALYSKLDSIVSTLQNWPIVKPVGQHLDKAESYFNKIKVEIDALERTKDEETKNLHVHKINFDFGILVRIKELMVDLSSGCMELALKQKREARLNEHKDAKAEGRKKGSSKMLWRTFQFAFQVYTFAGGHDDRAENLTRELAQEIESDPNGKKYSGFESLIF